MMLLCCRRRPHRRRFFFPLHHRLLSNFEFTFVKYVSNLNLVSEFYCMLCVVAFVIQFQSARFASLSLFYSFIFQYSVSWSPPSHRRLPYILFTLFFASFIPPSFICTCNRFGWVWFVVGFFFILRN